MLGCIPLTEKQNFGLKIVKAKNKQIGIGIIASNRRKDRWTDYTYPFILYYNGLNGAVEGDGEGWLKEEGEGFAEGD